MQKLKILSYDETSIMIKEHLSNLNVGQIDIVVSAFPQEQVFSALITSEMNVRNVFWLSEKNEFLNLPEKFSNVLITQSIFDVNHVNSMIEKIREYNPQCNITLYVPIAKELVAIDGVIYKVGLLSSNEFRYPWDMSQYTPLSQIEKFTCDDARIDISKIKMARYAIGFSSEQIKAECQLYYPEIKPFNSSVFHIEEQNEKDGTFYKFSSLEEYYLLNKNLINEKIQFIQENGFTHFIEDNYRQAMALSLKLKGVSIIVIDNQELFNINIFKQTKIIL